MLLQGENEWLREELEDTEKRLEDALSRLAGLEQEKIHWNFMEEVREGRKKGKGQNIFVVLKVHSVYKPV